MRGLIGFIFAPRPNRLVVWGGLLLLVGWILLPILIGFPLLVVGSCLFTVGAMISVVEWFPGGKKMVGYYKEMYVRMGKFLKILIKEGLG